MTQGILAVFSMQNTCASVAYDRKKRQTRRERFLAKMEQVVPWADLVVVVELDCPKTGKRGPRPMPVVAMLRIYFMQQWYALFTPCR